jgi:hypothetical protein
MHGLWAAAAAPPALTSLTFRGHETGGLPPGAWPRLAGAAALARLHLHALLEVPDALAAAVAGAARLEARVPRWGAPGWASWRPAGALAGACRGGGRRLFRGSAAAALPAVLRVARRAARRAPQASWPGLAVRRSAGPASLSAGQPAGPHYARVCLGEE